MEWINIRADMAKYFIQDVRGFTSPEAILNLSSDSQELYVGPIDWHWGSDAEINVKLDSQKTKYNQRCNQVEALLREAVSLIERCLSDSLKYDELNVEKFKVMIEFAEYDRIVAQQLLEQNDTDYWPGLIKEADIASQARTQAIASKASINAQYTEVEKSYNQLMALYKNDDMAHNIPWWNAYAGYNSNAVAKTQFVDQCSANKLDGDSRHARTLYETSARKHQLARQAITKEIILMKLNEFQRPGGALNYNERMSLLGDRALNDFMEVNARLSAICIGINGIYSPPDLSAEELDQEMKNPKRTRIEVAVNWLRKAVNALSRSQMDQLQGVVRYTIARQAGTQLIDDLRNGINFRFDPNWVTNMSNARLIGLSATAEPGSGDSWIGVEVKIPDQEVGSVSLRPLAVRLGRVSSSSSINARDVVGGRPIVNRSPAGGDGEWKVTAIADDRGEQFSRLHLDFHVAYTNP